MVSRTPAHPNGLRILYISQYFYPEQFLNNHVAKELVRNGHSVNVVCCVPNYPIGHFFDGYSNFKRRDEDWEGVAIHRTVTIPRGRSAGQLLANYLLYPVSASWRIFKLGSKRGQISFVSMPSPLFQALAAIFAKRVWKIPTVYWVQDIWPDSAIITLGIRNRIAIRILNAICGAIYRQADLIMVQSDGFQGKIAEFGVPTDRIVTLPNCAPKAFAPVKQVDIPDRIRALVPEGRRTIMFAGNIGESQDFDTIIAAVSALPENNNVQVVVIGSGRDEVRVHEKVISCGVQHRFVFLGRHPESDMPAFFACADIMLVSLRDEPIFALTVPSKVQAYMACGKPILACLRGEGAAVIKESGVGLVVSPSNPSELRDALIDINIMPIEDLQSMGRAAERAYHKYYSLDAVTEKLIYHLKKVACNDQENNLIKT